MWLVVSRWSLVVSQTLRCNGFANDQRPTTNDDLFTTQRLATNDDLPMTNDDFPEAT